MASVFFILPAAVVFALFVLYPLAQTVGYSMTDWSGFSTEYGLVGLDNYVSVLTDPRFYNALLRSAYFTVIHIILAAGGGLLIAVLISRVSQGATVYRTIFFFPRMLSLAVVGVTWSQVYNPSVGTINIVLKALGLGFLANPWLGDTSTALTAVAIASSWNAYGFYMVIFLASLQNIDPNLYEAAAIDGAGPLQKFWYVTVPGLYSTISLVLVLAVISGLKGFGTVWAMTRGGPVDSTELMMVYIWRDAFGTGGDLGRALAASVLFGLFVMAASIGLNHIRERQDKLS